MPLWTDRDSEFGWFDELTQSHLGNCYAISSINLVSTRPQLIKNIFVEQKENKAGIYTLKLYVRGRPVMITIDDEFHFNKNVIQFGKS